MKTDISAIYLKKAYSIASKMGDNLNIFLDKKQIVFQSIGAGNTTMFELKLNNSFKETDEYKIPLKKLKYILTGSKDDDIIKINFDDSYIRFEFNNMKRSIRTIADEIIRFTFPDEKKDGINFTNKILTYSSQIKNALKASGDMESIMNFEFNKNSITLFKDEKTDDFEMIIKDNNIEIKKYKKKVANRYNTDYLKYLFDNVDGSLNIETMQNGPMSFTKDIYKSKLKFMIAPLIKDKAE